MFSSRWGTFPNRAWPELTFKEMLKIAFRDKLVDCDDHAVIKRLRGEI